MNFSDRIASQSYLCLVVVCVLATSASPLFADAAHIEPDIVYGHKDGLAMTMDLFRPEVEANQAGIMFIVSGGWYSRWAPPEQMQSLFQPYLDEGYTVLAVRHGSSPRYAIPEIVSDVQRAVRFIRKNAEQWGIDAERLGVMGMSAGGHLSLMVGTTGDDGDDDAEDEVERASSRVAAVVALVPPTDLRVAVWEAPESLPAYRNFPALDLEMELAERYSPVVQASPNDAPALVMMGGKDELVPPKHGKWMAEAFEREGVEHKLVVLPNMGHNLITEDTREEVLGEIIGWFDKHLLDEED